MPIVLSIRFFSPLGITPNTCFILERILDLARLPCFFHEINWYPFVLDIHLQMVLITIAVFLVFQNPSRIRIFLIFLCITPHRSGCIAVAKSKSWTSTQCQKGGARHGSYAREYKSLQGHCGNHPTVQCFQLQQYIAVFCQVIQTIFYVKQAVLHQFLRLRFYRQYPRSISSNSAVTPRLFHNKWRLP
mgnify:CR=1 FL=1